MLTGVVHSALAVRNLATQTDRDSVPFQCRERSKTASTSVSVTETGLVREKGFSGEEADGSVPRLTACRCSSVTSSTTRTQTTEAI